jgi:two-component system, sensor histidine kinase and response regulator
MKKIIICVDDEKSILDSLRIDLKQTTADRFQIEVAESGEEALELAQELLSDGCEIPLIISDYIMPSMKGDELLSLAHNLIPDVKTIMLTGQAAIGGVTNAVNRAKLYRYIPKPWDSEDLNLTISEALKIYYAEKDLEQHRIDLEIANKRLSKLDETKTYFIKLLAHELKTPLTAINGFTEMIKASVQDSELIEFCEQVLDSTNRLDKFSEFSLLITEFLNETYAMNVKNADLYPYILTVLDKFNEKALSKKILIQNKLSLDSITFKFDPELIQKVLEIIIDNAIKYSENDRTIQIYDSKQNDIYTLHIRDHGNGFPEDALINLYKLFVSNDIMYHSDGYGLGLALSKMIMDTHSAKIEITNEVEGGALVKLIFNL